MKIYVGNRTSRLENIKYIFRLKKALTFDKPFFNSNPSYENPKWNKHCFINDNGEFPTGLLPMVCHLLGEEIKIKFIDERINAFQFEDLDTSYLKKHQKKAPKSIAKNKVRGLHFPSGVWSAATNSGKTYMATPLVKYCVANNIPTLLLIHKEAIFENHVKHFEGLGVEVGKIKSDTFDTKCFTIAMYETLSNRRKRSVNVKRYCQSIRFLIVDECHRAGAKDYSKLIQSIPAYCNLFMSGTAARPDELSTMIMHSLSGQIVYKIHNKDMDDIGESTKCKVFIYTNKTVSPSFTYKHKLQYCIHESKFRLKKIKKACSKYKKVLIAVRRLKHAEFLESKIKNAVRLTGTTKKKSDLIQKFALGEIPVLITTVLREGVNIKGIDCLIMAQGGKSEIEITQLAGRARRLSELGHFVLIDFIDRAFYEDGMFRIATYIEQGFEIKKINK